MKIRRCASAVLVFVALLAACRPAATPVAVETAPSPDAAETADSSESPQEIAVPDEGYAHVPEGTPIEYQHYPPASGPHYPTWLLYGLYEREDISEGYWVHNLEHGAIVILYKCDQPCPDLIESLRDLLNSFPLTRWDNRKAVALPYSKMDVPLMAVAWNVQMPLDEFDAQALIGFYVRHVDQGPENVP